MKRVSFKDEVRRKKKKKKKESSASSGEHVCTLSVSETKKGDLHNVCRK